MRQAIRLYGHEQLLTHDGLDVYRCSECSVRFEMEHTVIGARCCPACGVIYDIAPELQAEQLAHLALALNMSPTTLLWTMRLIAAAIASSPR